MKRIIQHTILTLPLIFQSCAFGLFECADSDCPELNVNSAITISLNFDEYSKEELSLVQIILIDKYNNSTLDTLSFSSPLGKQLEIGNGGPISFGEPLKWNQLEEVLYDYIIRIDQINRNVRISNIEIEKYGECCKGLRISTLDFDGEILLINSHATEFKI